MRCNLKLIESEYIEEFGRYPREIKNNMKIVLKSENPIYSGPRCLSFREKNYVNDILKDLLVKVICYMLIIHHICFTYYISKKDI